MTPPTSAGRSRLESAELARAGERLRAANIATSARYPGEPEGRQPVHTVYGGGHLFRRDTASRLGAVAKSAMEEYAPTALDLEGVIGVEDPVLMREVHARIAAKLIAEPVEDFRIDFEDGYGNRPDDEEDKHVAQAAREVIEGAEAGTLPPFIGIRIKPLTEELRARSVRTLRLFLDTLLEEKKALPANFVVTVPKVTVVEQLDYVCELFAEIEKQHELTANTLRFELMVETPQSIIGPDGRVALPALLDASCGRLSGAHFGTYDYTAGVSITAAYQSMQHPACDFARHMMQVSFAGTGVRLSDGSTTVLPVPPYRSAEGASLTSGEHDANKRSMWRAWRLHYEDVRRSLANGFYQGWDLHPAQLVTRYAAVFSFFLEGVDAAATRLHNFVEKAAQATLVGDVFDDAATGQGLLNYFLRGINCGALTEEEVVARTGVTLEELRGRSFVKILAARRRS